MNMAFNQLSALTALGAGGGTGPGGSGQAMAASGFAQLLLGTSTVEEIPQIPNPLLGQAQQITSTLRSLSDELALAIEPELGDEWVVLEDLQAFFAGEIEVFADAQPEVLDVLKEVQDLLRDILDIFPGILEDIAPLAAELEQPEVVGLAAIVEGLNVVQARMKSVAGDVTIAALTVQFTDEMPQPVARPVPLTDDLAHLAGWPPQREAGSAQLMNKPAQLDGATVQLAAAQIQMGTKPSLVAEQAQPRSVSGLALVTEVENLSVPDPRPEPLAPISPSGFSALRAMVIGAIQSSSQSQINSKELDQQDPALVTLTRPEPAFQDNFEHLEMVQQAQKSSNELPTKFASVLINQVSAVDIQEGTTRIELTPRGLGTVEVEMRTNSDGSLSVVVRAENHAVLSSLRQEHDLLAAVITEHQSVDLDFQEFEQGREQSGSNGFATPMGDGEDGIEDGRALAGIAQPILDGETLDLMT